MTDITSPMKVTPGDLLKETQGSDQDLNHQILAFAHNAAHDLKAPLRTISGYLSIIESDEIDVISEDSLKLLIDAQSAARRMGDLIS